MFKKAGRIVLMAVFGGALAACGGVEDAVAVPFAEACAEDDRWVSVEGVLALGDQTSCETTGSMEQCHIVLANPDNASDVINVTIEVDDAANRMNDIPDSYTDADLVVRDNAGTTVGAGALVRVIGPASNDEAGFACRIWVRQIEALP